jgi:hypothetical protein
VRVRGGAAANPTGANVVAGKADLSTSGKTLTVTNAPGTIINWQGFSIAPDELTRFIQQGANSAVLNRVVGQDPSSLLGPAAVERPGVPDQPERHRLRPGRPDRRRRPGRLDPRPRRLPTSWPAG